MTPHRHYATGPRIKYGVTHEEPQGDGIIFGAVDSIHQAWTQAGKFFYIAHSCILVNASAY
jgi:hypothetical protein